MRLIDADKLIEYIDAGKHRSPNELAFSETDVCEMINNQPTSYDVDGVIGDLSRAENFDSTGHSYVSTIEAVDIVKRGSV